MRAQQHPDVRNGKCPRVTPKKQSRLVAGVEFVRHATGAFYCTGCLRWICTGCLRWINEDGSHSDRPVTP